MDISTLTTQPAGHTTEARDADARNRPTINTYRVLRTFATGGVEVEVATTAYEAILRQFTTDRSVIVVNIAADGTPVPRITKELPWTLSPTVDEYSDAAHRAAHAAATA